MAKQIEDEVAYYYDSHPIEEDLMGKRPIMPRSSVTSWPYSRGFFMDNAAPSMRT